MKKNNKQKIEFSNISLIKVFILIVALVLFFLLWKVLVLLAITLIITAGFDPVVDFFEKKHIPRWLTTLMIFLFSLAMLVFLLYSILPVAIEEFGILIEKIPHYLRLLPGGIGDKYLQQVIDNLSQQITQTSSTLFLTTKNAITTFSSFVVVLIMTFYLLAQEHGVKKFIKTIFPGAQRQKKFLKIYTSIQKKMGRWMLGQLVSCLIVGVLTGVGLYLLGVPYAFVLALLAGVSEIIPFGPLFAFIPAVILSLGQSVPTGILVIALYIIIQQIEGNIIIPQIMRKAVGLNPVVVILAVLVGARLAGIIGLIVAIPTAAVFSVLGQAFLKRKKQ